jgi:outer membrane protein TolC
MPAEDAMRNKIHLLNRTFAANLPQLLVLAAWIFISACAGARNEAGLPLDDDGKHTEGTLPALPQQQVDAKASGDVSRERALPPASHQKVRTGNGTAKNNGLAAVPLVLDYQPFAEAEIKERLQGTLTMEDCIRIALHQNFTLRLAKHDLTQAEASLRGSSGKFLPVFALTGTQENIEQRLPFNPLAPNAPTRLNVYNNSVVGEVTQTLMTGAVLNFSGDLRDLYSSTKAQNLNYSVRLTQPLLRGAWPTVARSPISLARHDRDIREYQVDDAKLSTIFAVKQAYYNVLLARELIKVNRIALHRDSTLIRASESMMQAKRATQRDVLSAQIRLADDRAALIRSETEYQVALDALKEIIGAPLEKSLQVADSELKFAPVTLKEDELIRLALDHNPLLHSVGVAIDRARLSHTVARNAQLPQLDLTVGHIGEFETMHLRRQELATSGLLAAFTLSYPFLNREAAAAAENAQVAIAQEHDRLADLQRQIVLNIRSIVHNARSTAEELNALQGTITASQQKVDFATTMFNLGRASNLDITDAQEDLLKAQNQYLEKLVDYHAQLALLESLIGHQLSQ